MKVGFDHCNIFSLSPGKVINKKQSKVCANEHYFRQEEVVDCFQKLFGVKRSLTKNFPRIKTNQGREEEISNQESIIKKKFVIKCRRRNEDESCFDPT